MRTSVGMSVKEKEEARKKASVSYHERKADAASGYSELDHIERKHRSRAKSAREDLEEMRKDNYQRDGGFEPLTEEEKEKLKKEREKRWKRFKRERVSKMVGNVEVEKEDKLPSSVEYLEDFPTEPVTDEKETLFHRAEMILRKEIRTLVSQYHISARRKADWWEEKKKNDIRKRHTNFQVGNASPIQGEDFRRVDNNPKKVRSLTENYVDSIENYLEEVERRKIFEEFEFEKIDGIGPNKASALNKARSDFDGFAVWKGALKIREMKPTMDDFVEFLELNVSRGAHKRWREYDGIGPSTIEKLKKVSESIIDMLEKFNNF